MSSQSTSIPAEQLPFNEFDNFSPALTIHTHGKPNTEGYGCSWLWVAFDGDNKRIAEDSGFHTDTHSISANVAKFHALLEALRWIAVNKSDTPLDVLCDLQLAVNSITGVWKASKLEIRMLCQTARQYLSQTKARLLWIAHEQNKAA